jgi:ketopantoate reductase
MDAVFFFVKAHSFEAALKAAAPVTGPGTALVVFPEVADLSVIKGAGRRVVAALTEDRARIEGAGRVVHEAPGDVFLDAAAAPARAMADILKAASIPVFLDKKVGERRWTSLLAQVCVDVPAALADVAQKKILEPPLAVLAEGLLSECAAVSKAAKRSISPALLRRRRDALIMKAPDSKSPLGLDLLRGRPTERGCLLEPLLAAARKGKVKTPLLSSMDRLLRRLEKEGASA